MIAIRKDEAIEKLARNLEVASCVDLADAFAELFPGQPRPTATDAGRRRDEIVEYVRSRMAPEEMVDLWNIVFSEHRNVYYDDADGLLCYNKEEPWYAGR